MRQGSERPRDKYEGLSAEQREYLQELQEMIGGEEGMLAAEQQRLGMLLTDALNELDVPDAENFVAEILIDPANTDARAQYIDQLSGISNARNATRLLRELDRFLAKNL